MALNVSTLYLSIPHLHVYHLHISYKVKQQPLHHSATLLPPHATMKPSHLLPFLLPVLPAVHAWGSLGHMTIAYLAEHLVSSRTELYMQRALNNPSAPGYLGSIATWADSYRYTKDGRYSAHLHYIDADDTPPWSCGLDIERDCADDFCIVSAIGNYVCASHHPSRS